MSNVSVYFDITLPFSDQLAVWPGDTPVTINRSTGVSTVSELRMSSHVGTHIDAPAHFLPQGATVDQLPLDVLIGPAWVAHIPSVGLVTAELLDRCHLSPGVQRLLLRTDNSPSEPQNQTSREGAMPFDPSYVALDRAAGEWLLAKGIRLVGIDGPSVDPFGAEDFEVHRMLLAHDVVILENLMLAGIEPGGYRLLCLPLRYEGGDGAPARAVLEQHFEQKR